MLPVKQNKVLIWDYLNIVIMEIYNMLVKLLDSEGNDYQPFKVKTRA